MSKEELLKLLKENINQFDPAEQDVLNDVLEYNTKAPEEKKPDGEKKENEHQEEKPNGEAEATNHEDKPNEQEGKPSGESQEAKPEEEKPNPSQEEKPNQEQEAQPQQPMNDPRVDELVKQFNAIMGEFSGLKETISKIVVIKPSEEQSKGGYGETAKGNPSEVKNSSAQDNLIRSMGGYGR